MLPVTDYKGTKISGGKYIAESPEFLYYIENYGLSDFLMPMIKVKNEI